MTGQRPNQDGPKVRPISPINMWFRSAADARRVETLWARADWALFPDEARGSGARLREELLAGSKVRGPETQPLVFVLQIALYAVAAAGLVGMLFTIRSLAASIAAVVGAGPGGTGTLDGQLWFMASAMAFVTSALIAYWVHRKVSFDKELLVTEVIVGSRHHADELVQRLERETQ